MSNLNNNITFLLEEKDCNNNNEFVNYDNNEFVEYIEEDEQNHKLWSYTIKDLLKICNYYGLDKISKRNKHDIISTIFYFESLPKNYKIVQKRKIMWAYITELLNDPKMKNYILF